MPTGVTRVNGGIISDQMLSGSLRYFKMVGTFAPTVSAGTVTLDSSTAGGGNFPATSTYYFLVGSSDLPRPVPGSLADHALRVIMEKCTVVEIGLVGTVGAETEIHFSAANTSFGWIDAAGDVDTAAMVAAIAEVGATINVPIENAGAADDIEETPVYDDVSTTVTITEVPFKLA